MADTMSARQFWIQAPGHAEIVRVVLPPRQAGEVMVRTLYSGISRGTEALVFNGEVPSSQYEAMRAPFQEGDFPAPVKYGYANVGQVVDGPDHLRDRLVFCLYPHQDRYCVAASSVTCLPDDVPAGRAVLAANMETAVNAVWDGQPGVGDRIVVVGGGVVGLLIAWLCRRTPSTEVTVVDVNPRRAAAASHLDLPLLTEAPTDPTADLVFHASGQPEGLVSALRVAGVEATIVEASWYGTRSVPLPLGEAFHSRRLTIKSSQVGRLPPRRLRRWTHSKRLQLALELLREARLDVLITGESDFEELPGVLARLSRDPGETLCHRIRYAHDP